MGFIWLIGLAAAIWVIYDAWKNQSSMEELHKIPWTVFAVIASVLTAIIYYFVVFKKK